MSPMTTPRLGLSARIQTISPSPTLAVTALAKRLKAEGKDVISFGAGEPDFDTPARLVNVAKKALDDGFTRYTPVGGMLALRKALAANYAARGFDVTPDHIVTSPGAKFSLYQALQVLLDPGDEVIIPTPYWVSYTAQVTLAKATAVFVEGHESQGFKATAAQIEAAVTDKTKMLILNSPSNPTGAVYSRAELEAIGDVALKHNIAVVYDAIYAELVYGDAEFCDFATLRPGLQELTVTVDGLSKSHAMTGWRFGALIAPLHIAKAVAKLQSQTTSNLTSFVQVAAIDAFSGEQPEIAEMRSNFDRRRKLIVELLRGIDGVTCPEPQGAFYAFPNFGAFLGKSTPGGEVLEDDMAMAKWLLQDHGVAVVPGSAFGAPGCARLSYATSDALIREGVGRIKRGLESLT